MRQLIALSADEVEFLAQAVDHYCASKCPVGSDGGEGGCPLLTWGESVHTGALMRVCGSSPAGLRERLGAGHRGIPRRGAAVAGR